MQYYAFLNFIQKFKDIATSFRIAGNDSYLNSIEQSNIAELNGKLDVIGKYNKAFKLNNYLNWWSQWYMMWHGDLRPLSKGISSTFLVPNFTATFAISEKTRTFFKPDPSSTGTASGLKPVEEHFITIDYSSIKPIVNMTGLYATYLSLSLILAAVTLYVVIRRDFV